MKVFLAINFKNVCLLVFAHHLLYRWQRGTKITIKWLEITYTFMTVQKHLVYLTCKQTAEFVKKKKYIYIYIYKWWGSSDGVQTSEKCYRMWTEHTKSTTWEVNYYIIGCFRSFTPCISFLTFRWELAPDMKGVLWSVLLYFNNAFCWILKIWAHWICHSPPTSQ